MKEFLDGLQPVVVAIIMVASPFLLVIVACMVSEEIKSRRQRRMEDEYNKRL